jgi:hypothetical protein
VIVVGPHDLGLGVHGSKIGQAVIGVDRRNTFSANAAARKPRDSSGDAMLARFQPEPGLITAFRGMVLWSRAKGEFELIDPKRAYESVSEARPLIGRNWSLHNGRRGHT